MVRCRFVFDIVIVNILPLSAEFQEATDFNVDIQFNEFMTKITPSRINVTEFRAGYSYEYVEETDTLRTSMTPLNIMVNYGEENIGVAIYNWPEEVIMKLEAMTEVVEQEMCEFINDTEDKVGDIEILYRILPKCKDIEFDDLGDTGVNIEEMQEFLKKSVKENDLLFVLGEKKFLEPCIDDLVLENTQNDPVSLDLTKYREMSGRLVPTPSVLNTCCNPDCCGLKKLAKRQPGASMDNKLTCGGVNLMSRKQKGGKPKCLICDPNESSSGSENAECGSDSDPGQSAKKPFVGDVQWGGTPRPRVCLNTPPPELTQVVNITPKCCPVCRTNIDWLPALSPCPKCNYKPVPITSDAPYNMNLTADQIIRDFMNRERPSDPIDCRAAVYQPINDDGENAVIAKAGKQCANSRLPKACQNVLPRRGNSGQSAEVSQNEETCEGPNKLVQIFNHMKQLFNDAQNLEKRTEAPKERCGKVLNNREEVELTRKMFEPIKNYQEPLAACSNIEAMRERMSRGESLAPECNQKGGDGRPVRNKKRKRRAGGSCMYPCPLRKTVKNVSNQVAFKKNVPANVGWLWKKEEHAKLGWKPGAVRRPIRNIMAYFLKGYPPDTFKDGSSCRGKQEKPIEPSKPMLHICKRNGEYLVTLRPVVETEKFKTCYNPCKRIKPIQFTITKTPEQIQLRRVRDELLSKGFAPCQCGNSVVNCVCRCDSEKLQLLLEVMKECCNRGIGNCGERLVLNDEGDSEAEFEIGVTPPSGTKKPYVSSRKLATHGTQYDTEDLNVVPMYPKKTTEYSKPYQCDIGEKFETGRRKRKGK